MLNKKAIETLKVSLNVEKKLSFGKNRNNRSQRDGSIEITIVHVMIEAAV